MEQNQTNFVKHEAVPIRTVEYLSSKDSALPRAFVGHNLKQVPVCYQYCQTKQPNDSTDTDIIGYATNFSVSHGMMVCDVYLNPLSVNSVQFQNVIDNYTINIRHTKSELIFDITRLIIYNKEFKAARDNEIREHARNCDDYVE